MVKYRYSYWLNVISIIVFSVTIIVLIYALIYSGRELEITKQDAIWLARYRNDSHLGILDISKIINNEQNYQVDVHKWNLTNKHPGYVFISDAIKGRRIIVAVDGRIETINEK